MMEKTKSVYHLLVLDGHGSHLMPKFDNNYAKKKTMLVYIPPHSLHILQPLDVAWFDPLKRRMVPY